MRLRLFRRRQGVSGEPGHEPRALARAIVQAQVRSQRSASLVS